MLKGKDISWHQWKAGEDGTPENDDDKKPSKKWIVVTAICAIVSTLICVFFFGGGETQDNTEQLRIEQRYSNLKSMCENNINVGNAQNYTSLLSAKQLLDSLNCYQSSYQYISDKPENSIKNLESSLNNKLQEAQEAWIRSAQGQLNVAEDVSTAIMYYQIASLLKNSSSVTSALSNIARSSGCQCAYMAIKGVHFSGNNLVITYNGLNNSILTGVVLRYELTNSSGGNAIKGQANISINPGVNQSVTIALNGTVSDQSRLTLSNNNVVFYNSNIEE